MNDDNKLTQQRLKAIKGNFFIIRYIYIIINIIYITLCNFIYL